MAEKSANKSAYKNNVTRLLDSRKVDYSVMTYDYGAGVHSAVDVAAVVGKSPESVYKTLVVLADDPKHKPMLVIVPGPDTVDMKTLAKGVGVKKAHMSTYEEAEKLTGLLPGGISALALINKGFEVWLDEQARHLERITVSAGERGAQVELPVKEFIALTRARWIALK